MDHIDIQVLSSHPRRRRNTVWDNLDVAQGPVLLRTHACAHTRTGLIGLQVAMLGHFCTCPFPCVACSAYCASRWGATSSPGTLDAGFVSQDQICLIKLNLFKRIPEFCTLCQQGV